MRKVGAIVQARMSSQRFPEKVLYEVARKPMLQYLLERLERCSCLSSIVVATSLEDADMPIEEFCRQYGVACHRGPLSNVAGRFKEVLDVYHFEGFVRVCGDSPLLDQQLIDEAVSIYDGGGYEIVTNMLTPSYPKGQSVEVMSADTFRNGYELMRKDEDLEHVTKYFYENSRDFRIRHLALSEDLSGMQLSVDTWQDMDRFDTLVSRVTVTHVVLAMHVCYPNSSPLRFRGSW